LERQSGDRNLVVKAAELEQGQLIGQSLAWRPTNDHDALIIQPPGGWVRGLGGFDARAGPRVAELSWRAFDRSGQRGYDDEAGRLHFEPLDQYAIVKQRVCADDHRSEIRKELREASREKVDGNHGSMNVDRSQFVVPVVSALAFEAEQRMIIGRRYLIGL